MARGLFGFLSYEESELDPAVHSEILLETSRIEARVAILEIVLAILIGGWLDFFRDPAFRWVAIFCLATVLFLLVDSQARRTAARKLLGREIQVLPTPPAHPRRK